MGRKPAVEAPPLASDDVDTCWGAVGGCGGKDGGGGCGCGSCGGAVGSSDGKDGGGGGGAVGMNSGGRGRKPGGGVCTCASGI